MTDVENEVCYNCGELNRNHDIPMLYTCLAFFSNTVRKFDRIYNYPVLHCTKQITHINDPIHPEWLTNVTKGSSK